MNTQEIHDKIWEIVELCQRAKEKDVALLVEALEPSIRRRVLMGASSISASRTACLELLGFRNEEILIYIDAELPTGLFGIPEIVRDFCDTSCADERLQQAIRHLLTYADNSNESNDLSQFAYQVRKPAIECLELLLRNNSIDPSECTAGSYTYPYNTTDYAVLILKSCKKTVDAVYRDILLESFRALVPDEKTWEWLSSQ